MLVIAGLRSINVLFDVYLWEETLVVQSWRIYVVGEHVSVDEGIVAYKGNHIDVITIRSKPNPTGPLHYSGVDPFGYLFNSISGLGADTR